MISERDTSRLLTIDADGKGRALGGARRAQPRRGDAPLRNKDPQARAAYVGRLRAAGLSD